VNAIETFLVQLDCETRSCSSLRANLSPKSSSVFALGFLGNLKEFSKSLYPLALRKPRELPNLLTFLSPFAGSSHLY
jgi:hypothetical protein